MTDPLRAALKSQYHAALAMFRNAVEQCPDDLWLSDAYRNACWQIGYHALFFTHLYLQESDAAFQPWEHHQSGVQHADGIGGPPDPESDLPLLPRPYTRSEVLAYCAWCDGAVDEAVDTMDLDRAESGFWWYKIPKLEHQIVNIRHLQHHTAQLADRLRAASDIGVRWVGARREPAPPSSSAD